jgi:hypothetical protein
MKSRQKTGSKLTQAARTLGSVGGKKGGPARASALTPNQRKAIARKGAIAKNKAYGRRPKQS